MFLLKKKRRLQPNAKRIQKIRDRTKKAYNKNFQAKWKTMNWSSSNKRRIIDEDDDDDKQRTTTITWTYTENWEMKIARAKYALYFHFAQSVRSLLLLLSPSTRSGCGTISETIVWTLRNNVYTLSHSMYKFMCVCVFISMDNTEKLGIEHERSYSTNM